MGKQKSETTRAKDRARATAWNKANPGKAKARWDAWRRLNPSKVKAAKEKWSRENPGRVFELRLKKYGLTLARYHKMYRAQDGRCLICIERPDRLCVDHDHESGKVRGLLCRRCNSALGLLKDSLDALRRALAYLERGVTNAQQ